MADKTLRLVREARPIPGTFWRPVSHLEIDGRRLSLEEFSEVSAGRKPSGYPVSVEDPYKRGNFIDGFTIDSVTKAIVHDSVEPPLSSRFSIGALAVVWQGVNLGSEVLVAGGSEIMPRASIGNSSRIHVSSVIGKGALLGRNVHLLGTMIGPRVSVGDGSTICEGSKIARGNKIGSGVILEGKNISKPYVEVRDGAGIETDVSLGSLALVGKEAVLHPNVRIGDMGEVEESQEVPAHTELETERGLMAQELVRILDRAQAWR